MDTLTRYSDFTFLFACFVIRNSQRPVPEFPVHLHHDVKIAVDALYKAVSDGAPETLIHQSIHEFLMVYLRSPSPEALSNQWQDPLLRYLIVHHLVDNHGTFSHVGTIPPNLTKIQWCLRATAAHEIHTRKAEFENNCFRYSCSTTHAAASTEGCFIARTRT
jgi:hypothetical protein